VDWLSLDGTYIQGVVIKPDNYDPKKRYPIMTYYYRFFTDRLHDFNEPKTNHRPVFAQYVSDDYVVFLPDIRFEIGRPGFAATKSLVPGIQKLIELGIADEDKLGLHGHSWSGYQTAFIVTQTDIFDAAVSGAPVSNMTSAYSGIRWGSGLARQFQYEKTQSRIGQSLIEAPEKYIENSPVFFADKITTPMLIQHGDADGAVPWYQSIEMYLAMRRYNKDVIFLQYHDEPHHLQKFPNKLDYAIRMKEYFDYYLKGIGEPEWILSGETFQGR
jgi:dipeptidyl aminopeptidase/acylaminoacyl peptidase